MGADSVESTNRVEYDVPSVTESSVERSFGENQKCDHPHSRSHTLEKKVREGHVISRSPNRSKRGVVQFVNNFVKFLPTVHSKMTSKQEKVINEKIGKEGE